MGFEHFCADENVLKIFRSMWTGEMQGIQMIILNYRFVDVQHAIQFTMTNLLFSSHFNAHTFLDCLIMHSQPYTHERTDICLCVQLPLSISLSLSVGLSHFYNIYLWLAQKIQSTNSTSTGCMALILYSNDFIACFSRHRFKTFDIFISSFINNLNGKTLHIDTQHVVLYNAMALSGACVCFHLYFKIFRLKFLS